MGKVKAAAVLLLGIQAAAWCQTASLKDTLETMDVTIDLPQNIERMPSGDHGDIDYQVAFRFTGAHYEVRISLFPESYLERQSGYGDIDTYLPLFSMGLLAGIAKDSLYFSRTADLPPPAVSKEFGADRGMTALVKGNKSDFGKGYAQIAVTFVYKAGRGAVVVYFLYNDPRDLQMDGLDFSRAYYCFRFNAGDRQKVASPPSDDISPRQIE